MKISGFLNSFRDYVEKYDTDQASSENYDSYISQRLEDVIVDAEYDTSTVMEAYKALLNVKNTDNSTEDLYKRIVKRFDRSQWTNEKKGTQKLQQWSSNMEFNNILMLVDYLKDNMDSVSMEGYKLKVNQTWVRVYGLLEFFFKSDCKTYDPRSDKADSLLDENEDDTLTRDHKRYIQSVGSIQPLTLHMLEAGFMEKVIYKIIEDFLSNQGNAVSLLMALRWVHNLTNRYMNVCRNAQDLVTRTLKYKVEKEILKKEKIEKRADDLAKKRDQKILDSESDVENDDLNDVFGAEDVSDVEDDVESRILKILDHIEEDNYVQSYEKHLLFGSTKQPKDGDIIPVKLFELFCKLLKSINANIELESDYSIQGSIVTMEIQNHIWSSFSKLIEVYRAFHEEKVTGILKHLVEKYQLVDILCDYVQLTANVPTYDFKKYNETPEAKLEQDLTYLQLYYEYTLKMKVIGQVFSFTSNIIGIKSVAPMFSHVVCSCIDIFQESVTKLPDHLNKLVCDAALSIIAKYMLVSKDTTKQVYIQYTDFTAQLLELFEDRQHVDARLLHHVYANLLGLLQVLKADEFFELDQAHNIVDIVIRDFNSVKAIKTIEDLSLRQATVHFMYAMMKLIKKEQSNMTNRILAKIVSSGVPKIMNDFIHKDFAKMKANKKSSVMNYAPLITLPTVFATGSIMESALSSQSRDVREQAIELFQKDMQEYQPLINTYRIVDRMKKEEFSYSTVVILIASIVLVIILFPIAGSFLKK